MTDLQSSRLAELRAMAGESLEALIEGMTTAQQLPQLAYHFQRHGIDCGAKTHAEYGALFKTLVTRTDLRLFTALRPKDRARMWYRIDVDGGFVLQYNETRQRYWSFYRLSHERLSRFLEDVRGWWVEVDRVKGIWLAREW